MAISQPTENRLPLAKISREIKEKPLLKIVSPKRGYCQSATGVNLWVSTEKLQ